jgi:hypothetical protein
VLIAIDWVVAIHIIRALADDFPGNIRFLARAGPARDPAILNRVLTADKR